MAKSSEILVTDITLFIYILLIYLLNSVKKKQINNDEWKIAKKDGLLEYIFLIIVKNKTIHLNVYFGRIPI